LMRNQVPFFHLRGMEKSVGRLLGRC
jgi:hypothetical protein